MSTGHASQERSIGDEDAAAHTSSSWSQNNSNNEEETIENKKTFNCIAIGFKCSLPVCESETVLQLSERLGKIMQCPPSELILICKGRFISRHPMFSLKALGVFGSSPMCKLIISQRPPGPTRIFITTIFLCSSSLTPLVICMHADSPVASVKGRVRELLCCPIAVISLHLADGATLPDAATMRDLGVADGDRIYCRICSEEPEPIQPSAFAAAAAAVREQVRLADAIHLGRNGCKRPREDEEQAAASTSQSDEKAGGAPTLY